MERYLIDTNAVSDYLSASFTNTGVDFIHSIFDGVTQISVITQIELLCWKADGEIESNVNEFIGESKIFNITDEIIKHCVNIRKNKRIKTPDAIIAATALANGCILITNNVSDFINIKGLKLINPHTL